MNKEQIKEIICTLFLSGDTSFPIENDMNLLEEGICDSLGLVQFAARLEQDIDGLIIQDQDITHENFASINEIHKFVEKKLG